MAVYRDPLTGELIVEEEPRQDIAEEAVTAEGPQAEGPTTFAPFRFTQREINPRAEATRGTKTRSPRARSAFTQDPTAGIRSELQGIPTRFKHDMPVTDYYLPPDYTPVIGNAAGTAYLVNDPRAVAYKFTKGGGLEEYKAGGGNIEDLQTVEGYDVDAMYGQQGIGLNWLRDKFGKGVGEGEENFMRNLLSMPTSFNPNLHKTDHQIRMSQPLYERAGRGFTGALAGNIPHGIEARNDFFDARARAAQGISEDIPFTGYEGSMMQEDPIAFYDREFEDRLKDDPDGTLAGKIGRTAMPAIMGTALGLMSGGAGAAPWLAGGIGGLTSGLTGQAMASDFDLKNLAMQTAIGAGAGGAFQALGAAAGGGGVPSGDLSPLQVAAGRSIVQQGGASNLASGIARASLPTGMASGSGVISNAQGVPEFIIRGNEIIPIEPGTFFTPEAGQRFGVGSNVQGAAAAGAGAASERGKFGFMESPEAKVIGKLGKDVGQAGMEVTSQRQAHQGAAASPQNQGIQSTLSSQARALQAQLGSTDIFNRRLPDSPFYDPYEDLTTAQGDLV